MTEVGHGLCGWTEKWLVLSIKQSPGYTPLNSNDCHKDRLFNSGLINQALVRRGHGTVGNWRLASRALWRGRDWSVVFFFGG